MEQPLELERIFGLDDYDVFRQSMTHPHPDLLKGHRGLFEYMRGQYQRIGDAQTIVRWGQQRRKEDVALWSRFAAVYLGQKP